MSGLDRLNTIDETNEDQVSSRRLSVEATASIKSNAIVTSGDLNVLSLIEQLPNLDQPETNDVETIEKSANKIPTDEELAMDDKQLRSYLPKYSYYKKNKLIQRSIEKNYMQDMTKSVLKKTENRITLSWEDVNVYHKRKISLSSFFKSSSSSLNNKVKNENKQKLLVEDTKLPNETTPKSNKIHITTPSSSNIVKPAQTPKSDKLTVSVTANFSRSSSSSSSSSTSGSSSDRPSEIQSLESLTSSASSSSPTLQKNLRPILNNGTISNHLYIVSLNFSN